MPRQRTLASAVTNLRAAHNWSTEVTLVLNVDAGEFRILGTRWYIDRDGEKDADAIDLTFADRAKAFEAFNREARL